MAWNTDPVKLALDIPNIYQKFIRRQDSSMINNIIDSAGKYVAVELEKPTRDKILLTGNSQCVQKARTLIMAECDRLGNVLTKKTLDLAKSQYLAFMENVSEKIYNCKNVSIVGTKGKNNQYLLEIAGESLIVEEVLKCLETTLHENRATCVKYPYWICKYLSGSEDFENSLVDCFGNVQCEINPYEEAITVFCHHSITDAVLTKIRSFVEDFESQWLYDGLLVSDTVVRDLKDKNSEKLQRIEKETGAGIFIENQLDNLSIGESDSKSLKLSVKSKPSNITTHEETQSETSACSTNPIKAEESEPEKSNKSLCLIVGLQTQVEAAKRTVSELISFYDSFITLSMKVQTHLHRYLLDDKDKTHQDIINSYGPNSKIVPGKEPNNLDAVDIRGPEAEVKVLAEVISKKIETLDQIHHLQEIEIPEMALELILKGKDVLCSVLRKIGEVDNIQFPSPSSNNQKVISIVGRKEIVLQHVQCITGHVNAIVNSVTRKVPIHESLVNVLKHCGEAFVNAITPDAGTFVNIYLPTRINKKEHLTIFGPLQYMDQTIALLKKLTAKKGDYSCEVISVLGVHVPKLKKQSFIATKSDDVKIIFSSNFKKDEEEHILVIGHSDSVVQATKSITEAVTYLQNCLQKTIMIKADMKGDFLKKSGDCDSLVVQISRKHNVSIHIDEKLQENNCYKMKVYGCKKEVDEAIQDIKNMISTFQERIEAKVNISMPTISYVGRNLRQLLRETEAKLNVALSVSRNVFDALKTGKLEGNCEITIKGKHSDVAAAKDVLKEWKIESVHHPLPNCVQRYHFSHQTPKFNHLVHRIRVDVDLGCQRNPSADCIIITGLKPAVDRAVKYIEDVCESDFKVQLQVNPKYYTRLIGRGGSFIKDFELANNVVVVIPKPNQGDVVSIFGSKNNCISALENLKVLVSFWETTVAKEIEINSSIGFK
ncbi:Vigilin [Thelohanellus kitauei]|uniref:Vigilin n=1 Tax=Thelohanellus kitauei TaxID=669202 RepID=A0A0C2M6X7_THEKT|nr:Vigilin [Thelohanellus kitauei]